MNTNLFDNNLLNYNGSGPRKDYFSSLGLSKSESMIPNIAQGITSPYVSQINQMQIMNEKLKALEQKNQSDSEYLNRYLQVNTEKLKQMPQFTSISHNQPTSYSTSMPVENNYFIQKPIRSQSKPNGAPINRYPLQNYDPQLLGDDNGKRRMPLPKPQPQSQKSINPQIISQLQGDLFKTRDNIKRMKNNLQNIKSVMFSKMEEMEEKQNVTLEKLRNVIMIAKKNAERGMPLGANDLRNYPSNLNAKKITVNQTNPMQRNTNQNQRVTPPRSTSNNHSNSQMNNNNNSHLNKVTSNTSQSKFYDEISRIIEQKIQEHDRRQQRNASVYSQSSQACRCLPIINK